MEQIYTNEYLSKLLPAWNQALIKEGRTIELPLQRNFFHRKLKSCKEKTAVIISDAMRYEVGRELAQRLADEADTTVETDEMLAVLPSYTRLGMAALLPQSSIALSRNGKELADGVYCPDLVSRQEVLRKEVPNSRCVQFADLKKMKRMELQSVFMGQQVVYIYHDQIDNAGENSPEDVFTSCEMAIKEIADMVAKLSVSANVQHFIITADHGFIYKRDDVEEGDKISGVNDKDSIVKRRYIVSDKAVEGIGICHLSLAQTLGDEDKRIVSFPLSHNVFKASGGLNYVHGGSSPQELLVPLLDVKVAKGHIDTHPAVIGMVSTINKITNLVTTLEFVQSEAVSDVVKEARYQLYFANMHKSPIAVDTARKFLYNIA